MNELAAGGQVGLATVWLLGVSMGLTACTVTCMPFIGTWTFGRASGTREAFRHTLMFLAGRVLSYTLLAGAAGMAGLGIAKSLGGPLGNFAIGLVSIASGIWMLARARQTQCASMPGAGIQPLRFQRRADAAPPMAMGAALALTPCTPLASLLALAAQTESVGSGAGYGLAFGLGAAMTPILLLAPLAGRLGRELKCGRGWLLPWMMRLAGIVLLVLGIRRLGYWPF